MPEFEGKTVLITGSGSLGIAQGDIRVHPFPGQRAFKLCHRGRLCRRRRQSRRLASEERKPEHRHRCYSTPARSEHRNEKPPLKD